MPAESAGAGVQRLNARISGRVQGVGYRIFAADAARRAGLEAGATLNGYAMNLAGGSTVEIVAEGPRRALERLLELLQQGPAMAQVRDVDARWEAPSHEFDGFNIRH